MWATIQKDQLDDLPSGEHAAVVRAALCAIPSFIDLTGFGPIQWINLCTSGRDIAIRESFLRPRRDDYQQHEGLGTLDQIKTPRSDDVLPVSRDTIKAFMFGIRYGR